MFRLDLAIELNYEILQPSDFVFKIHASRTHQQTVSLETLNLAPDLAYALDRCHDFGNSHLSVHGEPGPLRIQYSAAVDVNHHFAVPSELQEVAVGEMPLSVLHYLQPSRYCPSDRMYQVAIREFGNHSPGYVRVQAIADWVRNRTCFQPGTTSSFDCALDTLNRQVGVCRDFAHLMIAMCRALNIPARYVTAVDFGADPALGPMGFHAYVEVFLSNRWFIFDPTGICIPTGLVRIATGRDANDVAFATIFGAVRWSAPKIAMSALHDPGAGFTVPEHTSLAVSTAGSDSPLGVQKSTSLQQEAQSNFRGDKGGCQVIPYPFVGSLPHGQPSASIG